MRNEQTQINQSKENRKIEKKIIEFSCLMFFFCVCSVSLKKNKNVDARGIEISKDKVQTCVSKGLTVIEGNAEFDLKQFPNDSFDYVILGQTLQAFINPEAVIRELLREKKQL